MTALAPPTRSRDRIALRPTLVWLGLIAFCCWPWLIDHSIDLSVCLATVGFPIVALAGLIRMVGAVVQRSWRRLLAHLIGALFAVGALISIGSGRVDFDALHFLLAEYPYTLQLRLLAPGERAYHAWEWGIVAPLAGPGVVYALVYDATGARVRERKAHGGRNVFVRQMGHRFYLIAEAEDDGDVCPQLPDIGAPLRYLGVGSDAENERRYRACEAQGA